MSRVSPKPPVLPPLLIHNSPYSGIKELNSSVWSLNSDSTSSTSSSSFINDLNNNNNSHQKKPEITPRPRQTTIKFDLSPKLNNNNNNVRHIPNTATRQPHTSILILPIFSSSTVAPQQPQQTNLRDTRIPFTLLNNNSNNINNNNNNINNNAKRRCHLTRNNKQRTCKELWNLPWKDEENNKLTEKFWFFLSVVIILLVIFGVVGISILFSYENF
ncbi:hypothetical protein Glove_522g27 [Diversispora epigaea]|uniref:Uncharacterized protein n=1 Tax=Diversispora epigaea TaxID=1348612 RepID=A0A397GHY6_9GLOM|nr:hypothetical protein Glove_522g27 [Diversispora epigaea]